MLRLMSIIRLYKSFIHILLHIIYITRSYKKYLFVFYYYRHNKFNILLNLL